MISCIKAVTRAGQMMGFSLIRTPMVLTPQIALSRLFAEETKEETKEEPSQAEFVEEPKIHNKYPHKNSYTFEHKKDNEPADVDGDKWFAVVNLSGTQYKLGVGDLLFTNKLPYDIGKQVVLNNVLLLGSKNQTIVGRPTVENARVVCSVEQQVKEKKVIVYKFHKRNRYDKKQGSRRQLTSLRVDSIIF